MYFFLFCRGDGVRAKSVVIKSKEDRYTRKEDGLKQDTACTALLFDT